MTIGEILVWFLDLTMLAWLVRQGEILLRNDKEKLELEREQHRMAKERYEERAKWREQKRKQQERKTIIPSETLVESIPFNGIGMETNIRLSERAMRDLSATNEETKL